MADSILNDYAASLSPPKGGADNLMGHISSFFGGGAPRGAEALAQNMPQEADINSVLGPQTPDPNADPNAVDPSIAAQQGIVSQTGAQIDALDNQLAGQKRDTDKRINALEQRGHDAAQLTVDAAKQKQDYERPLIDGIRKDYEALDQTLQHTQQEATAATQAQMAKWDAARMDAANTQIHEFFADRTAGGKIVGIISAALGGFANGLAGNPGAPTALDRIIQRDMDMQIQNLQQKNRVAAGEEGKLRILMESGLNQLQAVSALRGAINDKIKVIALDVGNRIGTAEAKAQAAQIANQADARTEQIRNQTNDQIFGERVQLLSKKFGVELMGARLVGSTAKAALALQAKDPLAGDVEGFPADQKLREAAYRKIAAYKELVSLSKESGHLTPNIRTARIHALARVLGGDSPTDRAASIQQATNIIGDRDWGIITDTDSRNKTARHIAAGEIRNLLPAGARMTGDLKSLFELEGESE